MKYSEICEQALIQKTELQQVFPLRKLIVYVGKDEWETLEIANGLAFGFDNPIKRPLHGMEVKRVDDERHLGVGLNVTE